MAANTSKNSSAKKPQPSKPAPRRNSTAKKPAAPKNSRSGRPKTTATPKSTLRPEITSIICMAIGLLLMLSLFLEDGAGAFGAVIRSLLTGLFGFGAYLSPLLVIGASLVVLLGRAKRIETPKLIVSGVLFWCVISFAHIQSLRPLPEAGAWAYISQAYTNGSSTNGGLFGALLGDFLTELFGDTGRYVVLVALGIVSLIFITGRSLVGLFIRLYDRMEAQREEARIRQEEEYEDDYAYEDEYDDDYYEDEPAIEAPPKRGKHTHRQPVPISSHKKRVFDHVIEEELDSGTKVPEARIDLINDSLKRNANDYHRIFDTKDDTPEAEPEVQTDPATTVHMNEPPTDTPPWDTGSAAEDVPAEADSNGEADNNGINVRGVGVEGYTPTVVGADGETFVPTGKAKDRDKILQEMTAIEQAARDAMNGESAITEYELPPIDLLSENPYSPSLSSKAAILENSKKLEETLKSFGVDARVVEVSKGPTVTRYELSPGAGVKVSKISGLADDLALSLAAVGIRIEAPIPGKSVVGIEIPNKEVQSVYLREVIGDQAFWSYPSKLSFAVGKDIAGNTVITDIAKMPHLLIAGATGSGKSVCINTLIASILYKAHPDEVKLLMIDPKVVELSIYNGIPHLIIPVVTEPKKASGALNWAVREMDLRYNMFAETKTRDLKGYNVWRSENGEPPVPQIVVVVDELADLMMTAPGEVEEAICRLAQKARAAGIHLVIATQRPSVDVITGLIKANVPSRLAFAVSSGTDSRTILDSVGAEKLLGKGDMLFSPAGLGKPQRIQGAFISDKEVERLVSFIKAQGEQEYDPALVEKVTSNVKEEMFSDEEEDEFLQDAIEYLVEREKASVSNLQRRFRIGYNRASRLMEDLENRGIVGPEDGAKPRKVLMTTYQFMEYKERRENMKAGVEDDAAPF